MSSGTYEEDCERCGGENTLVVFTDNKPVYESGICIICGYSFETVTKYKLSALEDVNEIRRDEGLLELAEFAKPIEGFYNEELEEVKAESVGADNTEEGIFEMDCSGNFRIKVGDQVSRAEGYGGIASIKQSEDSVYIGASAAYEGLIPIECVLKATKIKSVSKQADVCNLIFPDIQCMHRGPISTLILTKIDSDEAASTDLPECSSQP